MLLHQHLRTEKCEAGWRTILNQNDVEQTVARIRLWRDRPTAGDVTAIGHDDIIQIVGTRLPVSKAHPRSVGMKVGKSRGGRTQVGQRSPGLLHFRSEFAINHTAESA